MMQPYSENDLVRFLYHETSTTENHGIAYQLEDNGSYNECFQDLMKAKRILNSLKLSPAQRSTDHILRISRTTDAMLA